jgi:hypothetical protein
MFSIGQYLSLAFFLFVAADSMIQPYQAARRNKIVHMRIRKRTTPTQREWKKNAQMRKTYNVLLPVFFILHVLSLGTAVVLGFLHADGMLADKMVKWFNVSLVSAFINLVIVLYVYFKREAL